MSLRIVIAADHGGVGLKRELVDHLKGRGHDVTDLGTHSAGATDYPDYAHQVAHALEAGTHDRGVLVCGTGVGMAMAANRHPAVRAVNCSDVYTAKMSRAHNDANVLALGARVLASDLACEILDVWLATPFSGDGRHVRRLTKISQA